MKSALIASGFIQTSGKFVSSLPPETSFTTLDGPTSTQATSTPVNSGSPSSVKTIYVTKTTTYITTLTPTVAQGALTIAGISSMINGARGGELWISDYNLNFLYPRTTWDVCSGGNFAVIGAATPKPKHFSDIPQHVSFFSPLTSGPTHLSSCVYTNTAAPDDGDGGTLSCQGTAFPCVIATNPTLGCGPDALIGWDTYVKPLIRCEMSGPTTTVLTKTFVAVETSTTTIE